MWAEHRTLERVLDCQLEGMREILPELGEKVVGADSTFLPVNIPRNTREENEKIKEGKASGLWNDEPNKKSHKDVEVGWTEKAGRKFCGYKMHVVACLIYKLITDFLVTPANVHDSKGFAQLIPNLTAYPENIGKNGKLLAGIPCVAADSAYIGPALQTQCEERGWNLRTIERKFRNTELSEASVAYNRKLSSIRARIEHLFAFIKESMKFRKLRRIGIKRAISTAAGLCFIYNHCRLRHLGLLG